MTNIYVEVERFIEYLEQHPEHLAPISPFSSKCIAVQRLEGLLRDFDEYLRDERNTLRVRVHKPCPFCGTSGAALVRDNRDSPSRACVMYQIICNARSSYGCGASTGFHTSKDQAWAAWNEREEP